MNSIYTGSIWTYNSVRDYYGKKGYYDDNVITNKTEEPKTIVNIINYNIPNINITTLKQCPISFR